MSRNLFLMVGLFALFLGFAVPAESCTYFFIKAQDGTVVSVRAQEFYNRLGAQLQTIPRGTQYAVEAPKGAKGLRWKSKYGVVAISALGDKNALVDAGNEKGLYITTLWADDVEYPKINPGDSVVDIRHFVAWVAGNFATVDELKKGLSKVKLNGVAQENFNNGQAPPFHWPVTDADGNSVVLEYVDGRLKIWDNRSNGVLTNEPNLGWHLDNLRCFYSHEDKRSLGSDLKGLPGDYSSAGRFVRTSALKFLADPPKDADEALNLGIHIINTVDIPYGPQVWNTQVQFTPWHTFFDHKNLYFYYRTYENPNLRRIDLKKLDFTEGVPIQTIEIYGGTPYIDVTPESKE
ncbi:MAG: linear amide C-N hydrolase [Syntrophobacteraceae bacterium]|jgi:choloylglycine hydrolase